MSELAFFLFLLVLVGLLAPRVSRDIDAFLARRGTRRRPSKKVAGMAGRRYFSRRARLRRWVRHSLLRL